MSKKVVDLLVKYGPMLSGKLAELYEKEYNVSNTAARKALSRASADIQKTDYPSFEKNQKFLYLDEQYRTEQFTENYLN